MRLLTQWGAFGLLVLSQLLAGCSKTSITNSPSPRSASQNLVGAGQVPLDFVQAATGVNGRSYFRVTGTEPSGGNKLYTWKPDLSQPNPYNMQPAGYPNAAVYYPSPGAISVAARYDDELPIIVTAQNDVYFYDNGNGWTMLNSNGLKFLKIATRDFGIYTSTVTPDYPAGIEASGLLYGLGTDNRVYKYNTSTYTWSVMGSITAVDITVDVYGHPWVTSADAAGRTSISRAAGYGQTFNGWTRYALPGSRIIVGSITTNAQGTPGLAFLDKASGQVYWEPITNGDPTINNFQVVVAAFDSRYPYASVYCGADDDKMWLATTRPTLYSFEATFNP
ncbi:MAG: hypothetical protein ACRYF0_18685 [Janthinobacterium lividum]